METGLPTATSLFECQRQRATLSRAGCARLWQSAQTRRPNTWEGRWHCQGCSIGAAHAGRGTSLAGSTEAIAAIRRVCPRCRRPAARLINGCLCVSCFNRSREVARGRDAKGNRPQLSDILHTGTLTVIDHEGGRKVERAQVMGLVELMILAAQRASGPVVFTRAPAQHG